MGGALLFFLPYGSLRSHDNDGWTPSLEAFQTYFDVRDATVQIEATTAFVEVYEPST